MTEKTLEMVCEILANRVIQLEEELKYKKLYSNMLEEKIEKMKGTNDNG